MTQGTENTGEMAKKYLVIINLIFSILRNSQLWLKMVWPNGIMSSAIYELVVPYHQVSRARKVFTILVK